MDRIKIFKAAIILVSLLIISRLFYWQFIARISRVSSFNSQEVELPATRGEILASDNFPLVTNQEAFLIYAKPKELKVSPKDVASKLAPLLLSEKYATGTATLSDEEKKQKINDQNVKEENILTKLSSKNLYWVQLARKIPLSTKKQIDEYKLEGIGFEKDDKRFYPEASMAAQLLGFVASDKYGEDAGYFGLEGFYDSQLRGKPGRLGLDKDPFGFPILVSKYRTIESKSGDILYSTLDRTIQYIVEKKLKESVQKYDAKQGTVIVSDPATGHILAMATYPSYDPALYSEFDQSLYKNPAVADTYEPGSTFKLVTMAAALDTAVVTPETKCDVCNGPRQIGGYEISTWNKKYYPNSTMTEIIQHSDNVGMTFVAEKLGLNKFYEYILKFGFSKATSIDLQGESDGSIRPKNEWREVDLATASFGQGIAITPIQMVQATSVIANGGKLIKPSIVVKIKNSSKEEILQTDEGRRIISQKTAAQVKEMMVNAVQNGETKAFAPKDLRIAGKTGTAQVPVAGHYDPNKTIASFIGFAPEYDPK